MATELIRGFNMHEHRAEERKQCDRVIEAIDNLNKASSPHFRAVRAVVLQVELDALSAMIGDEQ